MAQLFRNNAFSALGAPLTNIATTLTVTTGQGDRFPTVTAPDFMLLTLQDASNNIEIVRVTARTAASDTMTITRAQEGTTARSWSLGDVLELRLTASTLNPLSVLEGANTPAAIRTALSTPAITGATASLQLPAGSTAQRDGSPTAGLFRYNSELTRFEGYNGSTWDGINSSSLSTQSFNGTGAQTAFTLSATPLSTAATEVFISGVRQVPTTNYTVSGTTLTFSVAPPSGTGNIFVRWINSAAISIGTPSDGSVTQAKLDGAFDATLVKTPNGTASGLTLNDGYTEEIFAVTGTTPALSPTNGSIQTWTLSGASTPTAGTWANGQSITLLIDDGTANTITWSSVAVTWKTNGGSAPTLLTSGLTVIQLWKVADVIYGARVGDA